MFLLLRKICSRYLPDRKNPDILHGKCLEVQFSNSGNNYEFISSDFKIHVDRFEKQKGYKMNYNVSEKLKEIDKQINTLLEEQSKLNREEKPVMTIKCGYKAQTVDITKDSIGYHCPIIDSVNGDFTFNDPLLENLVKKYKNFVDKKDRIKDDCPYNMSLGIIYKDETLHINSYNPHTSALVKRYIADENFTPKTGTLSLDKFVDQFVDFVNNKEEKNMKPENKLYSISKTTRKTTK